MIRAGLNQANVLAYSWPAVFASSFLCFLMHVFHPFTLSCHLFYLVTYQINICHKITFPPLVPVSLYPYPDLVYLIPLPRWLQSYMVSLLGFPDILLPEKPPGAPFGNCSSFEHPNLSHLCHLAIPQGAICNFYKLLTVLFVMLSLSLCHVQGFLIDCSLS